MSNRIRYYWPYVGARAAVDTVMSRLNSKSIPAPLASQYLLSLPI